MTRRHWIVLIVTLVGGGSVLGVAAVTRRASVAVTTAPPRARPVRVQEVRAAVDATPQTFTGVVRARHETDLAFRVGGKPVTRPVDVGTVVHEGQVLARLDPEDATLAVRAAEAELAAAAGRAASEARLRSIGATARVQRCSRGGDRSDAHHA